MFDPAFRMDVIKGIPPDPAAPPDPWAGLPEHTFTDATGGTFTSVIILIGAKDNNAVVRFSRDGVNYGDDVTIYSSDNPMPRYFNAQKIQVRNETAGSDADLQVEIYG